MTPTDSTPTPDIPSTADEALPMQLLRAFLSQTPLVPGRRAFFRYRDLGLEQATHGRMRANVSSSIEGMTEPTGWHYHECEMQFVYSLKGTVTLEFEDGTVSTFGPGDAFFIPGGVRHNEIHISPDREAIEISLPGKIGTVPCERPAHLPPVLRRVQG
jgi:mannose-6-phosphate isomerase-like protein (cupin superfamily)